MYDKCSCMLLLSWFSLIPLFLIPYGQPCTICSFGPWMQWSGCSQTCGGGAKTRQRIVCCPSRQSYGHCINTRCRKAQSEIWQSSPCNQDCYNGGVFDSNSCKCSPGWQGDCCNEACEYPYYGDNCHQQCDCAHGVCDHVTGKCDCLVGWTGTKCNQSCEYPYYGYSCLKQCDCAHGVCDHVTGKCDCLVGWTGTKCNQSCAYGYFGNDCQQVCSCENGDCHHVSGNCTCFTGWTGSNCSSQCDFQYLGNDCQEQCECENGICSHVTGNCTCLSGWTGKSCNDKVESSPFGTLFIWTATGSVVGFILLLICMSMICMEICRRKKQESQTTTNNTQTAHTNVEDSPPYHEYIDIENYNNDIEHTLDKYESLRTSGSYEDVSNYDIILKQNVRCENTMDVLLNQYEPLRGSRKISHIHIYTDNGPYDDSMYTEL